MADISQIKVSSVTYDVKDTTARQIATNASVGRVKPDGVSILVDANGVISGVGVGGSNIYVTTTDDDLIGATVTITDGVLTETAVMPSTKQVSFPKFLGSGWVTISATVGAQTAYAYVNCEYYGTYRVNLEFFSCTVNVVTTESDLIDGGHAYVMSEVAPDAELTFNNLGVATYIAHVPGRYTFYIF